MCLSQWIKRWRKRRRDRIYEGPSDNIDGGTRIRRDTDAPKEIKSRELLSFSLRYSTVSLMDDEYGLVRGVYDLSARMEDGGVCITADCNNPRAVPEGKRVEMREKKFLQDVDELLRKYNVSQHNGYYYKVSGLPDFYGSRLNAEYASGETVYCYNNQDPFLPLELLDELCRLYGIAREGEDG